VTTYQVPTDENVDTTHWMVVGRRAHENVRSPPTAPVANYVRIATVWRQLFTLAATHVRVSPRSGSGSPCCRRPPPPPPFMTFPCPPRTGRRAGLGAPTPTRPSPPHQAANGSSTPEESTLPGPARAPRPPGQQSRPKTCASAAHRGSAPRCTARSQRLPPPPLGAAPHAWWRQCGGQRGPSRRLRAHADGSAPAPVPARPPQRAGSPQAERRPWPHRPTGRPPVDSGGGTAQAARRRAVPARQRGGNDVSGNKGAAGRLEGRTTLWHWHGCTDCPSGTAGRRVADSHGGATSRGRRPGGSSRYAAFLVGRRARRGGSEPNGHGSLLFSYALGNGSAIPGLHVQSIRVNPLLHPRPRPALAAQCNPCRPRHRPDCIDGGRRRHGALHTNAGPHPSHLPCCARSPGHPDAHLSRRAEPSRRPAYC